MLEQRKQGGVTEPFVCLGWLLRHAGLRPGTATYESHEGEGPMAWQGCLKVSSPRFFRQHHASKGKHEPNVVSDFLQTGVSMFIPIVRSIDRSGTPFRPV